MDSSSREQPFSALKELAARLDMEITNAANRLEGRKIRSPACAMKIFDRVAALEAQVQLTKCRLQVVVNEKEASIEALNDCRRRADRDNQETLQKLMPLGFKVPDDLQPAVEHLLLSGESCAVEEAPLMVATAGSPCPSEGAVANLNPVFHGKAVRCSQLRKPSQLASHLSKPSQWPQSRDTFSQHSLRPHGARSKLERYLAEVDEYDTLAMMNCKPTPVAGPTEKSAQSSLTVEDVVQAFQQEPNEAAAFPSLSQASSEETYTCGIEPLPATPAPKESSREKGDQLSPWKVSERKVPDIVCTTPTLKLPEFDDNRSTVNFKLPEFGTRKPIVQTPEFKECPTPHCA